MKCPECGSPEHGRPSVGPHAWRKAIERWGQTFRVHECKVCGHIFLSSQRVLDGPDAERMVNDLELRMTSPLRGYVSQQSARGSLSPDT